MTTIEIAYEINCRNLWIETDSTLVVLSFNSSSNLVPWPSRNRWNNCRILLWDMNFLVTHIFMGGNQVSVTLTNIGVNLTSFVFMEW